MKSSTKRPLSLLTQVDVMAALHRCKYDPASAEASLVALHRQRESAYKIASASNDSSAASAADVTGAGAGAPSQGAAAEEKTRGKGGSKAYSGSLLGSKRRMGGNRWEDWSEADRAAFVKHLGDKVPLLICPSVINRLVSSRAPPY